MKLTKIQREKLRGMFDGRCAYCGIQLPENGWHADHVKPVHYDLQFRPQGWKDGEWTPSRYVKNGRLLRPENGTIKNLFPSCRACNIDKGALELEEWRGWLQDRMVDSMRRNNANFRHAERFGRVTICTAPLVFWFERCAQAPGI